MERKSRWGEGEEVRNGKEGKEKLEISLKKKVDEMGKMKRPKIVYEEEKKGCTGRKRMVVARQKAVPSSSPPVCIPSWHSALNNLISPL